MLGCMPNIKQTIDNQNKQKLRLFNNSATENEKNKPCNCRKKDECPLDGNCLQAAVIYQAKVTRTDNNTHETYVGLQKMILKRAIEIAPHHSETQHPETQRSSANTSGH